MPDLFAVCVMEKVLFISHRCCLSIFKTMRLGKVC